MNIIVVEDCEKDRDTLITYIQRYFHTNHLECRISHFSSAEDFLEEDNFSMADAIFLDIFIGDGNGLEVARQLRKNGYEGMIVFCTITSQYALEGYDVKAFGYIIKPYTYERIADLLGDIVHKTVKEPPSIFIKENRCWHKLSLPQILYAENHANYISICTEEHIYSTRMTFREIEALLEGHRGFVRCNRGTIVNLSYASKVDGRNITLKTQNSGTVYHLPISRRYISLVNEQYVNYIFKELEN